MYKSNVSSIKRAQKESLLLREISELFLKTSFDDDRIKDLVVNRVKLSTDKSHCTVYFYTAKGKDFFNKNILDILKCYKPSLRKAVAQKISSRYVPDLIFKYDDEFEKQQKVNDLIDKLKNEGKL